MQTLSFTWLGHATFLLTSPGGKRILFDPWVTGNPERPESAKKIGELDLMLITHGHHDHTGDAVSIARVERRARGRAVRSCRCGSQQKGLQNVTGMDPGGTLDVLGLSITMVPAVHSSSVDEDGRIVYLGVATGYVIRFEDGLTIYFAGDTSIFGDMRLIGELYRPSIAFLPIGDLLHDGSRAGGAGVRAARGQAGRADALRDVPGADRHARDAARARRAAGRAGAGAETRRDGS